MDQGVAVHRRRQEAFAAYVLPEVELLLRVARSLTRHGPDAEDLVQETLLRAYRAVDRFDGRHPRSWLLTILRNAQRNRYRRRDPVQLDDPAGHLERAVSQDRTGSPEGVMVDRTFDAAVEKAFAALPPAFQRVVALVDVEGLPYQEAADALGIPVGTVMSRLHRARRRMRRALDPPAEPARAASERNARRT